MAATRVRFWILGVTTLSAVLLYIDRAFLGWMIASDSFRATFDLSAADKAAVKEAFFWAYALGQVPAAYLAERYGKRSLMTLMVLSWSAFTVVTGSASCLTLLLLSRVGCGLAQAGAYPVASGLIGRWVHPHARGFASGLVSLGGRIGFAITPALTAAVIAGTGSWRWSGWLFGAAGLFAAFAFWRIFRDSPDEHPACNVAERKLLAPEFAAAKATPRPFPWFAILTNVSLWLMCAVQFLTNVGWSFVLNSLADYFRDVHHMSDAWNGGLSTVTLAISMFGLLAGGVLTDVCTRRFGVRLGRLIPIVGTRLLAGGLFFGCLLTNELWLLVPLIGLATFATDSGVPAMWTYSQDVGGRRIASVLAWANMWGNFGAALQPRIFGWVLKTYDVNHDYAEGFLLSGAAFVVAGLLAVGINAARPLERDDRG